MNNRIVKLIVKLNNICDQYYFINEDDDDDEADTDLTRDDVYSIVMEDKEICFLGKETVGKWVDLFYYNWNDFEKVVLSLVRSNIL